VSRFHSYINTVAAMLSHYKGDEPLASFLKKYFATQRKMGSTDRRQVASLCYSFFRLGKAGHHLSVEERILAGKFCCTKNDDALLQAVKPEWNLIISDNLVDKLKLLGLDTIEIFPFKDALSNGIDDELFSLSFLQQPDLFLRIRPGMKML
jgi:16S rRNA (cytosine967-C5)-methyltransferase